MLGQNIIGFLFAFTFTLQATAQYTSCIEDCASQALDSSGCDDLSDLTCICSDDSYDSFKSLAYDCVQENCPDELDSGEQEFEDICTGYTTSTLTSYSSTTETVTTDSVSSYSSSSSVSEPSYTTNYTETTPTISYNSTIPTVYSSTSSSANTSYPTTSYSSTSTSKSSSSVPANGYGTSSSPTTPNPAVTSYAGAAHRNTVLPIAFAELMAVIVAIAMLS